VNQYTMLTIANKIAQAALNNAFLPSTLEEGVTSPVSAFRAAWALAQQAQKRSTTDLFADLMLAGAKRETQRLRWQFSDKDVDKAIRFLFGDDARLLLFGEANTLSP